MVAEVVSEWGRVLSHSKIFSSTTRGGLGLCLNLLPAVFPHRADLDPIYYCELLHLCPVKDDGDAKITSLTVNPTSVPRGIGHQGYM